MPATSKALVLLSIFMMSLAVAQNPGDRPPAETVQNLKLLQTELQQALDQKDEEHICAVVERVRALLGSYAGLPEAPEEYLAPIDITEPDVSAIAAEVRRVALPMLAGRGSYSELGKNNEMELRESAYIALICLTLAETDSTLREQYVARAATELDYLLERQYDSGIFPYPAFPGGGSPPHVRAEVAQLREQHPDKLWNGYLTLDHEGGQFDTGCCAYAMIKGYQATNDTRYLESAKKAAEWSIRLGLSTNWNYNAFSVWHLAALHGLTGEQRYLDAAVEKAALGVLPGLMDNGRWVDQHNARASYHFVMVRALSELVGAMPSDHPRYDEIRRKTLLAAETRASEILEKGPANVESTLWGLSAFLEVFGPHDLCMNAAHVVVNATAGRGRIDPIATPFYLRYMLVGRK